jgi:hypothetical protein
MTIVGRPAGVCPVTTRLMARGMRRLSLWLDISVAGHQRGWTTAWLDDSRWGATDRPVTPHPKRVCNQPASYPWIVTSSQRMKPSLQTWKPPTFGDSKTLVDG